MFVIVLTTFPANRRHHGSDARRRLCRNQLMRNRVLRFVAYAAVGIVTGLVVAGVETLAIEIMLEGLLRADLWQQALAPGLGLLISVTLLQWADRGKRLSPATSEEYIRAYHSRHGVVRMLQLPFRLGAGIATVGLGGAVGLEGPSIYGGATIGSAMQGRLKWLFKEKDGKALLVAGAAAGVAAIFQAPATGVLFALESPYKGDLGRRALLPSLISAATSYATFVLITGVGGDSRPFDVDENILFSVEIGQRELVGAVLVGILCGAGARLFSRMVKLAKRIQTEVPQWQRVLGGAIVLGSLVVTADALLGLPLTLGPTAGTELSNWVTEPDIGLWLIGFLLVARFVATGTTLSAGGVGGVFIPLAVSGLLVGRIVGSWIDVGSAALRFFPFIGVAAFLAGGYRTPLAAVMFVAESTDAPQFVVPGLIAVAVSQVIIGSTSVSSHQHDTRTGHLEGRFQMPITSAMRTPRHIVRQEDSVSDFVWGHAFPAKEVAGIVADDDGHYLGMIRLHDIRHLERADWATTNIMAVIDEAVRPARLSWTIREAAAAMEEHELDQIPVVDTGNRVVGVVTSDSMLKLDEILEETQGN
jgi:chloride channel protein, CIC family